MKLYYLAVFNNHHYDVCWMGLGELICKAIPYIKVLHKNCYYYIGTVIMLNYLVLTIYLVKSTIIIICASCVLELQLNTITVSM